MRQMASIAGLSIVLSFCTVFAPARRGIAAECHSCSPLPAPGAGETVVTVSNASELQEQINNADGPTTIYLEAGTYNVNSGFWITVTEPDITIRSLSGNRDDVVIQGVGMGVAPGFGIQVYDSRITIADLTIRDVGYHAIQVAKTEGEETDDLLFHNIRCVDAGQQLFKSSGGLMYDSVIECSTFEYTTTLKAYSHNYNGSYTNGIDLVASRGWIIRDNVIRNIKHDPAATTDIAGPAILIWPAGTGIACGDTVIERNRVIDCDMGIFFGNSSASGVNHTGGVIRNNFIKGYSGSDVGLGLVRSTDAIVAHNTVFSPAGLTNWSMEARFAETTGCVFINNLADEMIWGDRNGAVTTLVTNYTDVDDSGVDFVDADAGDLHLEGNDNGDIIDAGTPTSSRTTDIDGCAVLDGFPDIGADEYETITTSNWTGTDGTDWNDPDNWSTGVVPDALTHVCIPDVAEQSNPFPIIASSQSAEAQTIQIDRDASLTTGSGASLGIGGWVSTDGLLSISGMVTIGG